MMQGVKADQVAAGERSSFARVSGRVLGWGANEYGSVTIALAHDNVFWLPADLLL